MQPMDFARAAKAERDALASSYGGTSTASAVGALLGIHQRAAKQRVEIKPAEHHPADAADAGEQGYPRPCRAGFH